MAIKPDEWMDGVVDGRVNIWAAGLADQYFFERLAESTCAPLG